MGTCPLPKINSTADIFCSTSNTHRLELVILPVRGWPSITVKRSLEFGVKNGGTWIIGQGAVGRICLFTCVSGSTVKPQKHLGLRKEKLQYGEFVGLPNKLSLSHNLLFPQDQRVNILIIKIKKKIIKFLFLPVEHIQKSSALIYWKKGNFCSIVQWYHNFKMANAKEKPKVIFRD